MKRLAPLVLVGCYSGGAVVHDINTAWMGRTRAEIEDAWGDRGGAAKIGDKTVLRWSRTRRHFELPRAEAEVYANAASVEVHVAAEAGTVYTTTTEVAAVVDEQGKILTVDGWSIPWGAPPDENMRWGTLVGIAVGMGRRSDTGTPLPSGVAHIGGMGPKLALVGMFQMVSGIGQDAGGEDGGAIGFAWSFGTAFWISSRLSVRAGPALVLGLSPGFADATLSPGLHGGIAYAIVKTRAFVLDARFDMTGSTDTAFGSVGIGANLQ